MTGCHRDNSVSFTSLLFDLCTEQLLYFLSAAPVANIPCPTKEGEGEGKGKEGEGEGKREGEGEGEGEEEEEFSFLNGSTTSLLSSPLLPAFHQCQTGHRIPDPS